MPKPFNEITTDAEYLRAVGMGPETHACEYWNLNRTDRSVAYALNNGWAFDINDSSYAGRSLGLHDTDPARKWDNLANVLRVLGPETDRRGWSFGLGHMPAIGKYLGEVWLDDDVEVDTYEPMPHIALLAAFYDAHAQGDEG